MTYNTIELDEWNVIGISVRTTNENGQAAKDIGALWAKFMGQGLMDKIPGKLTEEIYCIYTNYEGDATKPYTTIIGCKAPPLATAPEGFISKTIPSAKYQVYKSTGKLPDCVMQTWGEIWQSEVSRKYSADFDVYGLEAQNPENAVVYTYLSV